MAELVLRLRDRELSRTPIRNTRITLGRDLTSDVVIDNPGVSRTHAILIFVDEKFRIRDGSANGMTVNGVTTKDAILSYGDVIGIGKFEVVLQQTSDKVEMQTGSQARGGMPKSVVGTLQMDAAAAAKLREEMLAKAGGNRQSIASAQVDTLRPPPPKAGDAAPVAAAVVGTPPSGAKAPPAAAGGNASATEAVTAADASDAPAPLPVPPAALAAATAAAATRKPRARPKPMGVDVIAVLQLAGLGLFLIIGGLAVAWWMLENGKL